MNRNLGQRLAICVVMGTILAIPYETRAADEEQRTERIRKALGESLPYLSAESRKWMDGEVKIQNGRHCVSCHQVPAGAWSQSLAESVLKRSPSAETLSLMTDAVDFISSEDAGAAASWSQLLIAFPHLDDSLSEETRLKVSTWKKALLEKQRGDGLWPAAGQFFKQARPEIESDAVVSMWTLRALKGVHEQHQRDHDDQLDTAIQRAHEAVKKLSLDDAKTTEWIAWRAITAASEGASPDLFVRRLLSLQHDDGSWSWLVDNAGGDAYATGTVLFALATLFSNGDVNMQNGDVAQAIQRAVDYLLETQEVNGAWSTPSRQISAKESKRRDYVYDFWGSAWATIGLASSLDQYANENRLNRSPLR